MQGIPDRLDKRTKGQRDKGTKGQRDKGTRGQKDKGTMGQRDKITAKILQNIFEFLCCILGTCKLLFFKDLC